VAEPATFAEQIMTAARRAILDPGAIVKRGTDNDGNAYGESLDRWQDRALRASVVPLLNSILEERYELGHREGESCHAADWIFALGEYCELPEEVDPAMPTQVAKYIAGLQEEVTP
jgi:hypothetical protein